MNTRPEETMTMTTTTYIGAYGEGTPQRWGPTPKVHAVPEGTSHRRHGGIGMHAVSACGISVRHGSKPEAFRPEASHSCKRCAAIVGRI
jgi:hypothetical protein